MSADLKRVPFKKVGVIRVVFKPAKPMKPRTIKPTHH